MTLDAHDPGLHDPDLHDGSVARDPGAPRSSPPWVVPRWLALTWVAGGALGIAAALGGGILGTIFVGGATDTALEALAVSQTVLDGVDDTATVLDTTFTDVATTMATVRGTVDDTAATMDQVGTTLDDLTVLVTQDVPDSLDAVNDAMPQLVRTANVVDSAMRTLSFVGVDYDPAEPLGASLEEVRGQLVGIPPDLRRQRQGMEDVGVRLDDLADQSGDIARDLETVTTDLRASQAMLEDYRATADQAATLVDDLSRRLRTQASTARVLIVVLAITVAIGQTVPVVLGVQALRASPGPTSATTSRPTSRAG